MSKLHHLSGKREFKQSVLDMVLKNKKSVKQKIDNNKICDCREIKKEELANHEINNFVHVY